MASLVHCALYPCISGHVYLFHAGPIRTHRQAQHFQQTILTLKDTTQGVPLLCSVSVWHMQMKIDPLGSVKAGLVTSGADLSIITNFSVLQL